VTVEAFLPLGVATGNTFRLRLLPATWADAPQGTASTFFYDVYEATIQILPGAVKWPEKDQITALNETGFLVLPSVDLHHVDTPRLPLSDGTLRPVPLMDAFAWRNTFTYVNGTPTTEWQRSTSFDSAPLLQTAGLDRLELRTLPISVLTGPTKGRVTHLLGFGSLVDAPNDAPRERFWVVGCAVADAEAQATLTLREIGVATPEPLPGNRLITHLGGALCTNEGYTLVWG
jgi:hypothetical protein